MNDSVYSAFAGRDASRYSLDRCRLFITAIIVLVSFRHIRDELIFHVLLAHRAVSEA